MCLWASARLRKYTAKLKEIIDIVNPFFQLREKNQSTLFRISSCATADPMISAGTIVKHAKGFSDIQPIPPPKTSPTAHTKPITPKNETINPIAPLKKMCNIIK